MPREAAWPSGVPSWDSGKTLVVETVAGLVEDPVEGDHEVVFVVAGGHAGIARAEA